MTRAELDAWAEASELTVLCADGFDDAILGIGQRFTDYFVVYDYDTCIDILVTRDGMAYDDAVECFEFNTLGAFIGDEDGKPLVPCFLQTRVP